MEKRQIIQNSIISDMSEGVMAIRFDGRIELVNDAALSILERTREELEGRPFASCFFINENNDPFTECVLDVIYMKGRRQDRYVPYYTDRGRKELRIVSSYLKEESEKVGVILVIWAVLIFVGAASVGFGGGGMLMGGLYLLLGLILILVPALISDVLMALLAVGLIVIGVLSLLGIPAFGLPDSGSKIVNVAVAVLMIVTGIIALFNLDDTADVVMIVIGAFVAAAGIVRMYGAYRLKGVIA